MDVINRTIQNFSNWIEEIYCHDFTSDLMMKYQTWVCPTDDELALNQMLHDVLALSPNKTALCRVNRGGTRSLIGFSFKIWPRLLTDLVDQEVYVYWLSNNQVHVKIKIKLIHEYQTSIFTKKKFKKLYSKLLYFQ